MRNYSKTLLVNVDLDSLELYYRLHGLDPEHASEAVYDLALPRFIELFEDLGISGTFFVVGKDVERGDNRAQIERLVATGHEVANHSYDHHYDLSLRDERLILEDIERAGTVIEATTQQRIVGFRAPGYNINDKIYRALTRLGYDYDSSILPSPPYVLAKYAVIASLRVRGKRSASIWGNPWQMFAKLDAHDVPGFPQLSEIPVTVLPFIRFPVIGTTLSLFGMPLVRTSVPLLRRLPIVNLEFHGVDLLELVGDKLPAELRAQSDLPVSLTRKRRVFSTLIRELLKTHRGRTLAELTSTQRP